MPTLSPKGTGLIVSEQVNHSTTTGFSTPDDDFTTDANCYIKAIEIVVPSGETVTIEKKLSGTGNKVPIRTAVPSGIYAVGEDTPLEFGDTLEVVSNGVVSGDREIKITVTRE